MTDPVPPAGSPVLAALAATASAVALFLYLRRPPAGRATLLASLPWVALAVALHAVGGVVDYPSVLSTLLGPPWVYLVVAVLGGLAWGLVGSAVGHDPPSAAPHYVGASGFGALLPPWRCSRSAGA